MCVCVCCILDAHYQKSWSDCLENAVVTLKMLITVAVFVILTSAIGEMNAQSGFCTRDISGLQVVDMCEGGSWTLGRVFLSANSSAMGDNSRCVCTLKGKTSSQNTTTEFYMWEQGTASTGCLYQHEVKVAWPAEPGISSGSSYNFTCLTRRGQAVTSPEYTLPVTLTQLRSDVSSSIGFCLFLQPEDYANNTIELTCQGTPTSTSTVTASSSLLTSSPTLAASPESSPETSTSTTASAPVITSSAPGDITTTPETTTMTVGVPTSLEHTSKTFPTGPVAGGVVGGVVLIAIVIVVIVVCTRRKEQPKPPRAETPGAVNRGYENALTDNILYESSSGLANNQSPPSSPPTMTNGEGAYQSIDENGKSPSVTYYSTSGGMASVSTGNEKENPLFGATNDCATVDETTPRKSGAEPKRTSAPPPATSSALAPAAAAAAAAAGAAEPPSDQYAVVNKPLRQKNPTQNAAAKSKSANVTLPSGDVYAVVDRSTNRGSEPGPAHSPPPEVSPPPAPASATTPGLVYADLDLVTTPRSSAGIPAPLTDYSEIDHEASARL